MLIGFLAIFILIFLIVYAPFNMNNWAKELFLGYVLVGGSTMFFSQFILRPLIGLQQLKIYSLLLWCIFEVLLITLVIYLFFSPSFPSLPEKLDEYYLTLTYVALIVPGPYLLFVWYLGLQEKVSSFQTVSKSSLPYTTKQEDQLLRITGDNEKIVLAIKYHQLLYVKSSGNYLDIFYLKGDTTTKEVVRLSLKELEEKIDHPDIIRTHRSYIVNKEHISSFKRTRKGYELIMQFVPKEILPVSSGHKGRFEEILQLNASH